MKILDKALERKGLKFLSGRKMKASLSDLPHRLQPLYCSQVPIDLTSKPLKATCYKHSAPFICTSSYVYWRPTFKLERIAHCLPYDRISPNPEIAAARMATLAALADGFDRPAVVLTTVNAATQRVPARDVLRAASFTAEVGQRLDLAELRSYLARMGYQAAPAAR